MDRAVCGRVTCAVAEYGDTDFAGQLNIRFKRSVGQSFGCFLTPGMNVQLIEKPMTMLERSRLPPILEDTRDLSMPLLFLLPRLYSWQDICYLHQRNRGQLTRQLGDQENVTDLVARLRMQSNALRLFRAQHADSSNVNGSYARSAENRPPEAPEILGMTHGHSFTREIPSELDQLLRNLFPAVNSQEAATVSDQGTLLSNLMYQIMSVVSQHINGGADGSSSVEENQDRGASSSRPDGPSSPPSPKRQKIE
nr:ferredoxin-dependent glutamate synthase, chloroplastic [Tanacetum cinerariifolium]